MMIKIFQSYKHKKAFNKVMTLWYQTSMNNVTTEDLFEPRPKVGTVCYFIGAIDSMSQRLNLDDLAFGKLAADFFRDKSKFYFN
jgi:hypothetical protein